VSGELVLAELDVTEQPLRVIVPLRRYAPPATPSPAAPAALAPLPPLPRLAVFPVIVQLVSNTEPAPCA
jgi:hypothetical protein